jgi:hypothetical protein
MVTHSPESGVKRPFRGSRVVLVAPVEDALVVWLAALPGPVYRSPAVALLG